MLAPARTNFIAPLSTCNFFIMLGSANQIGNTSHNLELRFQKEYSDEVQQKGLLIKAIARTEFFGWLGQPLRRRVIEQKHFNTKHLVKQLVMKN